jgi:hypothetical protein
MYISKYSNNKEVSSAQYITELICENKAKKEKTDLHYRFWVSKKWERYYKDQIASAHRLLKKYSVNSVIAALRSEEGQKVYSLRAPFLVPIIEEKEQELLSQNNVMTQKIDRNKNKNFSTNISKKNILSRIEELDNDNIEG